ncbi:hypothetical protein HY641_01150 [Candidatus Woesearchaeota archaeon]|nr:hypothetical protein [Candidatus Woesearchaeota archaeon]
MYEGKIAKDVDHCLKAVAELLGNEHICEAIVGPSSTIRGETIQLENPPKMACITDVAAATGRVELCEQVSGIMVASTKIDCVYAVARATKNPGLCSRIGVEMNQEGCRKQAAKNT